jgi:transcriptional regulator with PAS, ATPase and Fis domain
MYSSAIEEYERTLEHEGSLSCEESAQLRVHLADCLLAKSRCEDARSALLPLLSRASELSDLDRARAMARIGWAEFFLGDLDCSRRSCEEAVALLLPTSHHEELAQALRWLGYALRWRGDLEGAADRFRDAVAAARRVKGSFQLADCLRALGNLHRLWGNYRQAIAYHEECRSLSQHQGRRRSEGIECIHLGLARLYVGEWTQAEIDLEGSLRIFLELGLPLERASALLSLARLHRRRGEPDHARESAEEALTLAKGVSFERGIIIAHEELGDIALESGDPSQAQNLYEQALAAARALGPKADVVHELAWRVARAYLAAGETKEALALAEEAVRLARESSDRRELGHGLATMALVAAAEGDWPHAQSLTEESIDLFAEIQTPYELAQAHEISAELLRRMASSSPGAVLRHLFEAHRLYAKLGASRACEHVGREIRRLETPFHRTLSTASAGTPPSLITKNGAMLVVVETSRQLAFEDSPVLIEGETGTGKELVARLVHEAGPRKVKPFVPVNCAAVSEQLLESELFGHRRGSFTGADRDHTGILESAEDGTVLLDEIDKAPLPFQAKLLRVIDERKIRQVGASSLRPLHARILCATNRDLPSLAEKGMFLQDLYYRLSVFRLVLPSLRERLEDVAPLTRHFLQRCAQRFGVVGLEISSEAEALLASYDWPGNVRELKNVIEAATFYARESGVVQPIHLPREIRHPGRPLKDASLPGRIEELERSEILAALEEAKGVKTEAARILGVSRKGLNDRLRRLGLEETSTG